MLVLLSRAGATLLSVGPERWGAYLGRSLALSARLGHLDRGWLSDLRGDALVVGVDTRGGDCDVPAGALVAACRGDVAVTLEMDPAGCLR